MTELILLWPMVAMPALDVTRAVADRKLSLSAAAWEALLSGRLGRCLVVDQLETDIASSKSCWIPPVRRVRSREEMAMLMLMPSLSPFAVGAKMSISRWKSSHQKGAGEDDAGAVDGPPRRSWQVVLSMIVRMIDVMTVAYSALFLLLVKPRQVDLNSGGSCKYVSAMKPSPWAQEWR